jgi:hypothetical protein
VFSVNTPFPQHLLKCRECFWVTGRPMRPPVIRKKPCVVLTGEYREDLARIMRQAARSRLGGPQLPREYLLCEAIQPLGDLMAQPVGNVLVSGMLGAGLLKARDHHLEPLAKLSPTLRLLALQVNQDGLALIN